MQVINPGNLPAKFLPFLVGSQACPAKIKEEIDAIFQGPLTSIKNGYIFDAGRWVLKSSRIDGTLTTPDTHVYRVRKAEKIRTFIRERNLGEHLEVPNKYLYWCKKEQKFYVVAEKLQLSSEVAWPASSDIEYGFKIEASIGGQAKALAQNAPKRNLTAIQARALAQLSTLGYTDLTYNNLYFTNEGKVAILDTEPLKRAIKKKVNKNPVVLLFGSKVSQLCQQSIAGIAKLKLYVDDRTALKEVERVERTHALWTIAQLIAQISVVTFAIYFTPAVTALIPIAAVASALKVSFIVFAVLKNLVLMINILSVYWIWHLSYQGIPGIQKIIGIELQGII